MKFSVLVIACILPVQAWGFCLAPSEPYQSYERLPAPSTILRTPNVPFCMSNLRFGGSHTCSQWEIDGFFNDVEDFQSDLNQYISDVYRFTTEQIDYANALCSVAQQAEAYADCEMNDLMSEIGQ